MRASAEDGRRSSQARFPHGIGAPGTVSAKIAGVRGPGGHARACRPVVGHRRRRARRRLKVGQSPAAGCGRCRVKPPAAVVGAAVATEFYAIQDLFDAR